MPRVSSPLWNPNGGDVAAMQIITPHDTPEAANPSHVSVRHLHANPHIEMSLITLQPGEVVKPHKTSVDACFYVLEGTPTIEIEGESAHVEADSVVPSAPRHLHSIRNEGATTVRFLVIKTPNPKR